MTLFTTAATVLLSRGVRSKYVQELLGHATIAITLETHSHVLLQIGGTAASAMDAACPARGHAYDVAAARERLSRRVNVRRVGSKVSPVWARSRARITRPLPLNATSAVRFLP